MFFVIISSIIFLNIIDHRMRKLLIPFFDSEVERFTTVLVNEAFSELDVDKESFYTIQYDQSGNPIISYNTFFINQLSNQFSDAIQKKQEKMELGEIGDSLLFRRMKMGRFHQAHKGILCEVSFGALRGSTLFANIGPVIPIRLVYLGQMNPDIKIKVQEYGYNNTLLKIDYVATIKEQISMPFSSKQKTIQIRQPLVIDIISGKIPNYYHAISK